jgi:hypothetical protein
VWEFAKSAAAQYQKKTDQIRRERKQGNIKAIANDLRRGVARYKCRCDHGKSGIASSQGWQ